MYLRLRKLRNEMGITARDMADLLGLRTENAYYKKENGLIKFSLEEAGLVSKKIGLPVESIFFTPQVSDKDTLPTGTDGK
jgi:putative transcriptional regulator